VIPRDLFAEVIVGVGTMIGEHCTLGCPKEARLLEASPAPVDHAHGDRLSTCGDVRDFEPCGLVHVRSVSGHQPPLPAGHR
jgi:hypothetical protein